TRAWRCERGVTKLQRHQRNDYARSSIRLVIASAAASAISSIVPTAARIVWSSWYKTGRSGGRLRRCGSRTGSRGGGGGGVSAPTAVGGRRAGGCRSPLACVGCSNSSSLGLCSGVGGLGLRGLLSFPISHTQPNG